MVLTRRREWRRTPVLVAFAGTLAVPMVVADEPRSAAAAGRGFTSGERGS